jgi:hypothetical protein
VAIVGVTITHGSAQFGGIDLGASTVPAKITSTAVVHNRAGGVFVDDGRHKPTLSIATSSLVGNRAARNGGGIFK